LRGLPIEFEKGEKLTKKFKAKPTQLFPEIFAIALAGLLTFSLQSSNAPIIPITVFPETTSGITLNAGMFVVLMAATGTIMYLFIKFGLKRFVSYMINLALLALLFFLFTWYGSLYADYLPPFLSSTSFGWLIVSVLGTVLLGLLIYKSKGAMHLVGIVLIGGLTGTFLGVSIPTLTAIVLLLALAGYDLFAVYKGPIGKIAQSTDLEDFTGAVFTYGDLTVGMGDMVFYSMLASNSMMNFGPVPFLGAAVGLVIGAYLGFKMLEGRDMFPGLPFAIILGLVFMYAASQAIIMLKPA
jgi:presenilin-like A22 family membrane protease